MIEAWDTVVIFGLIGYEMLAVGSQQQDRAPRLPLITTMLMASGRAVRWAFSVGLFLTMLAHLALIPGG